MTPATATCAGCDRPLGALEAGRYTVCMECTRARHRAAHTKRCACGREARPVGPYRVGGRRWLSCRRCLGTIKQL
jgi:hypothetical protein